MPKLRIGIVHFLRFFSSPNIQIKVQDYCDEGAIYSSSPFDRFIK